MRSYRGETSGRPAVAVAGGEDFEHPAQALRRSEASSAIPVRRPVRAVGAGLRAFGSWRRRPPAGAVARGGDASADETLAAERKKKEKREREAAQRSAAAFRQFPGADRRPRPRSRGARQAGSTESRRQDRGERRARLLLPSRSLLAPRARV